VAASLFDAYLSGEAAAFYAGHFAAAGDRRRAVARAVRPLAPAVADALAAQNARLAASPARDAHLAALRAGAAAVVTGQQVGLFLGPLFTVYKAASAIRVARALRDESGQPVVPIFWLQTEDHDLPEIAACHVPRAHGSALALTLPADADGRQSIAHRPLPDVVVGCLAELGVELAHLPHAAAHLERLARHYRPGRGWSEAFAGVLAELFAPEGLVLLDPRDPALATAAAPLHRQALIDAAPLAAALAERDAALAAAGFAPPVHVRAGAPLSFVHPDGADGPRYRLAPSADGFALVGRDQHCTLAALLAALAADPLSVSSSALLRPIVQDALLPTAAYVGGPGEVAYFAQLAPLYAAFDLAMPLLVPRARLCVVEPASARLLARLRLASADARRSEDELLAAARDGDDGDDDLAARLLVPFDAALGAARGELEPLGDGIRAALDKTRQTVGSAVRRLAAKVEQARHHADGELVEAVRRLRRQLFPGGAPQERIYGLPWFAARHGERPFLERVLTTIAPFDAAPRDLRWDEEATR
jgi:bacillithiol biosynthesis cysteine-adding enzyme BshC